MADLVAEGLAGTWTWAPLVVALAVALMLPALISRAVRRDVKGSAKEETRTRSGGAAGKSAGGGSEEKWIPTLTVKPWQDAYELLECPWDFSGCSDVGDVLDVIWREPIASDLQECCANLRAKTEDVSIARVDAGFPLASHYAAIYRLSSGGQLFGGAPVEHAVGLDMSSTDEPDLPERPKQGRRWGLSCLGAFYRIHDGFGKLINVKHLPLILGSPGDEFEGSCHYVYPVRGQEAIAGARHLLKFARVDRRCCACVDRRTNSEPGVTYVENSGDVTLDEESPLSFIADTIDNVTGLRPPGACYGMYDKEPALNAQAS